MCNYDVFSFREEGACVMLAGGSRGSGGLDVRTPPTGQNLLPFCHLPPRRPHPAVIVSDSLLGPALLALISHFKLKQHASLCNRVRTDVCDEATRRARRRARMLSILIYS